MLYVLPFYLSPTTRPSPHLSRDAPTVIRARIRFVSISVALSSVVTIYVIAARPKASWLEVLRLLGWYPLKVYEIATSLLLTAILFAGPLFEKGVVESRWRDWIRGQSLHESLSSWIGWRNYVAVCFLVVPVCFRAAMSLKPLVTEQFRHWLIQIAGPHHRRDPLPFADRSVASSRATPTHPHNFLDSSLFWHCSYSSLL